MIVGGAESALEKTSCSATDSFAASDEWEYRLLNPNV